MGDDRAGEALDHLQTAALELIHAARAFLDVAEDVVSDPDKVADVVDVLGGVADAAARAARGQPLRARERGRGDAAGDRGDDHGDDHGGIEHITVT